MSPSNPPRAALTLPRLAREIDDLREHLERVEKLAQSALNEVTDTKSSVLVEIGALKTTYEAEQKTQNTALEAIKADTSEIVEEAKDRKRDKKTRKELLERAELYLKIIAGVILTSGAIWAVFKYVVHAV